MKNNSEKTINSKGAKNDNPQKQAQKSREKDGLAKTKRLLKRASLELLKFVVNAAEATAMIADKKAVYRYAYGMGWSNREISHGISRLKRSGYVKINHRKSQNSIQLTNKAKLKIVEHIVKNRNKTKKYRFLSFDIPTTLNNNRNSFRKCIKQIGFVKIQQSLWAIDKDVSDLVETAMYECKVEKYVAYIVSEQSDIDGVVKKILEKSP